jgi:hypothetical protein
MTARRLLVVMLVLLGVSTLAAALAPQKSQDDTESGSTPTPTTTGDAAPPDRNGPLAVTIDAADPKIDVVPLTVNDQLQLDVTAKKSGQVQIPEFGLISAVSRDAPAMFDLLFERPGAYRVVLADSGRLVGRLEVSPAAPPGSKPAKARRPGAPR